MGREDWLMGALIVVALAVLVIGALSLLAPPVLPSASTIEPSQAEYQRALAAQNPSDKCATPPGYTDQSWREHMSHHPDQYRECLNP